MFVCQLHSLTRTSTNKIGKARAAAKTMATQSSGQFTSRPPIYFYRTHPTSIFLHILKKPLYTLYSNPSINKICLLYVQLPLCVFSDTTNSSCRSISKPAKKEKEVWTVSSLLKGVWTVIIIHSFKAGGATVPPAQIGFQAFVGVQNMHVLVSTVK